MRFAETTALLANAIARAQALKIGGRVMLDLERSYRDAVGNDLRLKGRNARAIRALRRFEEARKAQAYI